MAEEVQYSSGGDSATNKRKYDEQPTPPSSGGRRSTGFSAPIASQSPDSAPSYNSVPPPLDDIQLAKQRAQEIAARLCNTLDAKRPRVENGGSGGYDSGDNKGFSSAPADLGQKPIPSVVSSVPALYGGGHSRPTKNIEIPNNRVGVIIGKGGETIKYLQTQSGARIQVTRDVDADPNSLNRAVELEGLPEQIAKAEQLIHDVISEAETGGSGIVSRRLTGQQGGTEQFVMKIPNNKVGLIIGKGGETIKTMQTSTNARIQVIPLHLPPGDTSLERTLQIDGTSDQIEAAKVLVNEVLTENRLRNQSMSGYQQGYQARAPASWAPPGQQQPGYGYIQPGAYPGQTPQYNMPQSQYPGYPPQPTSGGYGSGWDQTTAATNQQTAQGGGYDYYGQQSAPQQQQASGGTTGTTDNTGYGYNQQAVSGYNQQGQGYAQDGYGGYHSSAPQPGYGPPQPGYDQQQGGYNSTGYGTVSNQTAEGQTASYGAQGDGSQAPPSSLSQQGYNASQQPSPNPGYAPQTTQPGYGVPPTSQTSYGAQPPSGYGPSYAAHQAPKAAAGQATYGQPQQSPTAQGGYAQPTAGYPHSQPPQAGYAQPDATAQRAPSAYGTAPASAYAPPPYGAPPVNQPSYVGQQPAPYNSSYGSGYSQPAAYSADGGSAAPAPQAVTPSTGAAKASPQS